MSAPPAVEASPAAGPDREGASSSPCDETCQVRTERRKGQPLRQRERLLLVCRHRRRNEATTPKKALLLLLTLSTSIQKISFSLSLLQAPPPPPPPPRDDLLAPGRRLAVVSTAAPPWMTGTAVNPTLRAAFLAKELGCKRDDDEKEASPPPASSSSSSRPPRVTLVVPWLNKTDQGSLFPEGLLFDSPWEQEVCLRSWVRMIFYLFFFFPF